MIGERYIFSIRIQGWLSGFLVGMVFLFSTFQAKGQGIPYSDFYNMLYPAQAVACGLTINDSIDERRHPLMMARAIQHWKLTGCIEPMGFEEKNTILTHQIENWDNRWQPVRVFGNTDLSSLSEVSGISESMWVDKNPQFTYRIIPKDSCWLFIPGELEKDFDLLFSEAMQTFQSKNSSAQKPDNFYTVIVRSGESLSLIARREEVTVEEIQAWNGLNDFMIHPGQELIIGAYPTKKSVPKTTGASETITTTQPKAADGPVYVVKPGDSLWSIARMFPGVSAENIIEHNHLKNERIDVGQKLIIPKYE
jgi:LysM repeat protein